MQPIQRSDQYCRAHRTALAGMCADELSGLVSFGMIVKGPESPVKNSRTGGSGHLGTAPGGPRTVPVRSSSPGRIRRDVPDYLGRATRCGRGPSAVLGQYRVTQARPARGREQ